MTIHSELVCGPNRCIKVENTSGPAQAFTCILSLNEREALSLMSALLLIIELSLCVQNRELLTGAAVAVDVNGFDQKQTFSKGQPT